MYSIRFWNKASENIMVGGKYMYEFDTREDAWNAANALCKAAMKLGAIEADINNEFYDLEED